MADVGVYAGAMRFSQIWWVVPPMIVQTLAARYIYPNDLGDQLQRNVARIIAGMAMLSLIPCFMLSALGPELIDLMLGKQYAGASSVLMIHIWTAVLVFIDAPANQYLLATQRQFQLIVKSGVLLALNFGLVLILVPHYGPQGAAMATLISQAVVVLLLPLCYAPLRDLCGIYRLAITEAPGLLTSCTGLLAQRFR
jgi:PST family polysaccharide transporter